MTGCGVLISKGADGQITGREGQFVADNWVGSGLECNASAAQNSAAEADVAAQMARTFQASKCGQGLLLKCRSVGDALSGNRFFCSNVGFIRQVCKLHWKGNISNYHLQRVSTLEKKMGKYMGN